MAFGTGLARLVKACRQEIDVVTLEVYTEALCYQIEPAEWEAFTRSVVASGRFSWFPKVAELLDALREYRGEPSRAELDRQLSTEAGEAYQAVMDSGIYTAEGGTSWNYRTVVEKRGRAAGEAFIAAGGDEAFRITDEKWNYDKRRERFVAAYQVAVREQPALSMRALPAPSSGEQKQIGAGDQAEADPQLTAVEAKGFLDNLRKHLPPGELPAMPKESAFAVNCPPDRYAELRAQAERIKLEDGAKAS
jgi:hypothetical protein